MNCPHFTENTMSLYCRHQTMLFMKIIPSYSLDNVKHTLKWCMGSGQSCCSIIVGGTYSYHQALNGLQKYAITVSNKKYTHTTTTHNYFNIKIVL